MANNYKKQLEELLSLTVKEQASDLHLSVGHPPALCSATIVTRT